MHTTLDIDFKLKEGFRSLFPDYATKLEKATSQEEINRFQAEFIEERKQILAEALGKDISELEASDQTAPIPLKQDMYKILINATGDDIKKQLHVLIDGLNRLQGMEDDDAGLVTAQILVSGALGIGLLSTSTVIAKLAVGAAEAVAAFAGVTVASVGAVVAIAALVIVAIIIPIIYFMAKPANAIVLLINELDKPLTFVSDHNVHGKPMLMTTPIPEAVVIPEVGTYPVSGLIATEKRENALVGTQYGFTMQYGGTDTKLSFGVECPLTGIYTDNNCYCAIDESASTVAEMTTKQNKQFWEDEKNGIKLSIRCNSGSGSIAYYVARAYRG
ncbi:hypothetical protein MHB44_15005 [Lysinibacillus sp. FSL H8-0500]|uniref:Uncharacterized protein n=1 Tax=Lysinibacillus macroides TaxID=33935 RepID=A0A0N0CV19_9BACI|nr:hypothetical protein [Lysinibacillus macroides]KOY80974.1 hypothetical protein ADM90_17555 [Lysinibacillus macroides]QPR68884.1 hypothetical protein I6G82_04435 [Lysinibacillus macroides]